MARSGLRGQADPGCLSVWEVRMKPLPLALRLSPLLLFLCLALSMAATT